MNLAPNFTLAELDPRAEAPAAMLGTLTASAEVLQSIRDAVGVPLRVTSGYRSTSYNAKVGGSPTSAHLTGRAVDFVPVGITLWEFDRRLREAEARGAVLPYVELIYYPFSKGHVHIQTLGGNYPRTKRVELEGEYKPLTTTLLASFPGAGGGLGAVVILLVLFGTLLLQALSRGVVYGSV